MDDSALYTGLDEIPKGTFGNEVKDEDTQRLLDEERKKLKELTPQLESIVEMIEKEQELALEFIAGYVDSSKDDDTAYRAELKAAGRYRLYLNELKTKFKLALNETRK